MRPHINAATLSMAAALLFTKTTCSAFAPVHQATDVESYREMSDAYNANSRKQHSSSLSCSWRLEYSPDDDRRPARPAGKARSSSTLMRSDEPVYANDWTVERYDHYLNNEPPQFPHTMESLTDAAWEAVAGTLYGKQRLDPNVVSNAMTRSIYGYRPVRHKHDVGRIGLEIDGANYLSLPRQRAGAESCGTALRKVALELGAKLSQRPWKGFETKNDEDGSSSSRPVAIYFSTIKQSLMASRELLVLKRQEVEQTDSSCRFDNISIHCLQQDGTIPKHMQLVAKRRRRDRLANGVVDPKRGVILVVQPTDYNDEFRPPGPAVDAVGTLQQLVARASVNGLPCVVMSPRFLAHQYHATERGWDQSGYQQASVYGGAEPPRGPTPWVMRDFTPPVFTWVGCALPLSDHDKVRHRQRCIDDHANSFYYSRVVCTQSVMQEGHPWHMFAVKEFDTDTNKDGPKTRSTILPTYQYLASTKTSSGRPPRDIVRHIFNEWS